MPIQRGRYTPAQQWAQTATLTPTVPLRRPTPTPGPTPVPGPTATRPADFWAARAMMSGQGTPGIGGGISPAGGGVPTMPIDPWATGPTQIRPGGGRVGRGGATIGQRRAAQIANLQTGQYHQAKATDPRVFGMDMPEYVGWAKDQLNAPALAATATAVYRAAQLEIDRLTEERMREQMEATQAYNQQSLSQSWAIAQMSQQQQQAELAAQQQQAAATLAQRKREMGAQIGTGIAGLQAQTWAQGLPYQLPKGTMFAPGFGPGGPMSEMARRAGVSYMPPRIPAAPPPSRREMEEWIQAAISKFGG